MQENEILSRISGLSLLGYFSPNLNCVCVHFFDGGNKNDVIAYLKPEDLSWEIREILDETTTLLDDREVVTIMHNRLGVLPPNSIFDRFVRKAVLESNFKDIRVKEVLENGYKRKENLN